jgi:hypothetical protein
VVDKELCQTCKDGYLMIEGENRCLTSCPEGYFRGKRERTDVSRHVLKVILEVRSNQRSFRKNKYGCK